jgi:hypothetical protein
VRGRAQQKSGRYLGDRGYHLGLHIVECEALLVPCGVTELQHAGAHVIAVHCLLCVVFGIGDCCECESFLSVSSPTK